MILLILAQENESHYQQLIDDIKKKQSAKNPISINDEFTDELVKMANNELVIGIHENSPHGQVEGITDHSAFGHHNWCDVDLLKKSSNDKKILDQSKTTNRNKTRKAKGSANKKRDVRCGNIVSYFSQTRSAEKNDNVDINIEIDLTKEKGTSINNINGVDSKCSMKLQNKDASSFYLAVGTDDDDDIDDNDEDKIMTCSSRKLPSIYETEDHDEIMPESPSIFETEDFSELVILQQELQCNPGDAFNSTALIAQPHTQAFPIDKDLSPVRGIDTGCKRKCSSLSRSKIAGSFCLESRLNCLASKKSGVAAAPVNAVNKTDLDNSVDSHCSELSVEISNLVGRPIVNPHVFSSDSENEFSRNKLSSRPIKIRKKCAEKNNYSKSDNVIPIPPSDLNFCEADFY